MAKVEAGGGGQEEGPGQVAAEEEDAVGLNLGLIQVTEDQAKADANDEGVQQGPKEAQDGPAIADAKQLKGYTASEFSEFSQFFQFVAHDRAHRPDTCRVSVSLRPKPCPLLLCGKSLPYYSSVEREGVHWETPCVFNISGR